MLSKFYIWLIFAVIGGMLLHNLIIFRKKLILHRIGQPRILFRMTLAQRVQHMTAADQLLHPGADWFRACIIPTSWLAHDFRQRTGAQLSSIAPPAWC